MDLEKLLIPGENSAQLHQLAASLTESWRPADFKEEIFLNQLIHHNWQLERLRTVESQMWAKAGTDGCADFDDLYARTEKRVADLHRLVAGIERCISRATTDLRRLQEARMKQSQSAKRTQEGQVLSPVQRQPPKQTRIEAEIAAWPEPEEKEQSQFEYPPVPEGADERQFPSDYMRRLADWRSQIKKN